MDLWRRLLPEEQCLGSGIPAKSLLAAVEFWQGCCSSLSAAEFLDRCGLLLDFAQAGSFTFSKESRANDLARHGRKHRRSA